MSPGTEKNNSKQPTHQCAQANGPYPDHLKELCNSRYPMKILEYGLSLNRTQWGAGGYVTIPELPSGVCNRASLRPEVVSESTAVRILGVPGGFVSSSLLRSVADIADTFGEGHVHWTTAGTAQIYTTRDNVTATVRALNEVGLDVGSTGDDVRSMSACPGTYRCDVALINAPEIAYTIGSAVIDDQQYPGLPHKIKTGVSGCPNDCMRCQMQKDHAFVGVFRGAPKVDHSLFAQWAETARPGVSCGNSRAADTEYLLRRCPTQAIERNGNSIAIAPDLCVHCMLCINKCPAIRPGDQRGVAWVVGGKYGHRGPNGPMVSFVLAPFVPAVSPGYDEIIDLYQRFLDIYVEYGRRKERVGDMIIRLGLRTVLELMKIEPDPAILIEPTNKAFIVHNENLTCGPTK